MMWYSSVQRKINMKASGVQIGNYTFFVLECKNVRYDVFDTRTLPLETDNNDGTAFSPFPEYESCQECVSGCRLFIR